MLIKVPLFLIVLFALVHGKKQIGEVCSNDDDLLDACEEGLICKKKGDTFVCIDENLAEPGAACGGLFHFGKASVKMYTNYIFIFS